MSRRLVLSVVFLLLAVPAAQAKAPPSGVDVCGAANACVHVGSQDAEQMFQVFGGGYCCETPAAPAPFYVLRWQWEANGPETQVYYLPRAGKIFDPARHGWIALDTASMRSLNAARGTLEPNAVPTFTAVTVGGRAVRDPASYVRLFAAGRKTFAYPKGGWLRVAIEATGASPWTGATTDVRISRRGAFVWIDNWVLKVPAALAKRARAGLSLR
jgi:hypothetical protein